MNNSSAQSRRYMLYAIGEIVLVVVGILIALQINNWNEARKENLREIEYLERLKENLSEDLRNLDLNKTFYETVFSYGKVALSLSDGERNPGLRNWEILVSFFHASQIWTFISQSSTFEELKSAGELSLVRSPQLRNNLSFYYGQGLIRYKETVGINPPYRKMVRTMIPSSIQNYMWENCHKNEADTQILTDCDPGVSENEAKKIIDFLIEDDKLIGELRFYMSSIKVGFYGIDAQMKLCAQMLDEINDILNE